MPLSSVVVAGNPALVSQYNNLRIDAMARIETVTAGESWNATTPVTNNAVDQAYSLPTLVQQDSNSGKWLKMAGTIGLGPRVRVGMAYEASAGDGSSVRIYLPGSLITGLSSMTAELGRTASNSLTSGAVESTVLPPYYTYIGWWPSATTFMFEGLMFNNINLKQLNTPVVSGEAFSVRELLYLKASDGKAYKADADAFESGICETPLFAAQAATGADQTIRTFTPGAYINGFSGLTPGVPYYPSSTAGAITTTQGAFARIIGYAISSSELIFFPGKDNTAFLTRTITAGENWTAGDLLYQKKSDARYYKADADVAESGICENPAVAAVTHTGGAGNQQLAYFQGSILPTSLVTGTLGDRVYPSATAGAYQANTPASYDTFYRVIGYFIRGNVLQLSPQEMIFLPTGVQEKGYCSAESVAGPVRAGTGVNFKKIMVNTPSSITFSSISTSGVTSGPTALNINRFGFGFQIQNSGSGIYNWYGTYQTVGN